MRRLSLVLALLGCAASVALGSTPGQRRNVLFGSGPARALRNGLVTYWKLEEASGTRYDSSGNGNSLTSNNSVGQAAGIYRNAASFVAASSQYLTRADNATLRLGAGSFSIAGWFNATSTATSVLLGKGTALATGQWGYAVFFATGTPNQIRARVGDGTTAHDIAMNAPSTGSWHFFVVMYNAVNHVLSLSLDGGAATTATVNNLGYTTTAPFAVGAETNGSLPYGGRVDELGLWMRLLTSGEQAYLYNGGSGRTYPWR